MKKKRLGRTELLVSEVGLGGIPLARVSETQAINIVRKSIDLGINFIDTANAYKDSESKIGKAIINRRESLILATKSTRRNAKEMLTNIENSLKMLQTDYIDLFQIHQVSDEENVNAVFAKDGALEAAKIAKQQGKILHIGITSHRLETAIELVKTNEFETIQFGANLVETDSLKTLFPLAKELDMGCIVMKPLAGGELTDAKLCFRFLQQYPDYIPIPGFSEEHELLEIIDLYENKAPLTEKDIKEIENIRNSTDSNFCRRCCYCEPCPQGVKIFAGMAIKRIIKNYGKEYKADWFIEGAESIDKCSECGICETKCPYNLPIRETIKQNKAFYDEMIQV